MGLRIISTEDGSDTLYNEELDEIYHSQKGAVTESLHIYIEQGLKFVLRERDEVNILEVGMGTGLNVLLTVALLQQLKGKTIRYTALEPFPVSTSILGEMKYDGSLSQLAKDLFPILHSPSQNSPIVLSEGFWFEKYETPLQDFLLPEPKFDLVYFDAFAPQKAPELWARETLSHLAELMSPGGVIVTYCAQGQFKRDLKSLGFEVTELKGPPGKRSMTRGVLKG